MEKAGEGALGPEPVSEGSAGSGCEISTTDVLFLINSGLGCCASGERNLEALPTSTPGDTGVRLVPLRRKTKVLIVKQDNFYWQECYSGHESVTIFTNV